MSPTTADINNFGVLIDALHAQTSSRGMLLSAAVDSVQHIIPLSVVADLDWIAVMDYDLDLGDHAPYYLAVQSMNGWAAYGVPKAKLLMGVPFYGRDTLSWSDTLSYGTIVNDAHPALDVDQVYDPAYGRIWYYNGIATMQRKARYVLDNGFGGMMIWELGQDHFDAQGHYDQWSLLPAIKSVFAAPPGLTLTVQAREDTAFVVLPAVTPIVISGSYDGVANYSVPNVASNTAVTLTAATWLPIMESTFVAAPADDYLFVKWTVAAAGGTTNYTTSSINLSITADTTATAIYKWVAKGDITEQSGSYGPPDGLLSFFDLMRFIDAYGASFGQANYARVFDFTGADNAGGPDGTIDFWDFMRFADVYGSSPAQK
jgi:hypothetical protein